MNHDTQLFCQQLLVGTIIDIYSLHLCSRGVELIVVCIAYLSLFTIQVAKTNNIQTQ